MGLTHVSALYLSERKGSGLRSQRSARRSPAYAKFVNRLWSVMPKPPSTIFRVPLRARQLCRTDKYIVTNGCDARKNTMDGVNLAEPPQGNHKANSTSVLD